jgi:hypothetical protein
MTKLRDKRHFLPVHVLLYTLPGIPSVYYGSEFGIEGRKERGTDASLRPALALDALTAEDNVPLQIIISLGKIHSRESALWYGDYSEMDLTTLRYAFMRGDILVTVNNSDSPESFDLGLDGSYTGALYGEEISSDQGRLRITLEGCGAEIWIPAGGGEHFEPLEKTVTAAAAPQTEPFTEMPQRAEPGKAYEEMSIEELQAEILAKLSANGPLTDRMKQEVSENVYRDSLLNWVKSFR